MVPKLIEWDKFTAWDELAGYVNASIPGQAPASIWAMCVLPNISVNELPHLAKRRSFKNSSFSIEPIPKSADFWLLTMRYKGHVRHRTVSIPLRVTQDGWILLFKSKTELQLARILTRRLYPRISRSHLTNVALEKLVSTMIPSSDYYVKPIGCEAVTPALKDVRTDLVGTTRARLSGPDTARILKMIQEKVYNLWIDNLEFEIRERHSEEPIVSARLTRDGLCEVRPSPEIFELFVKLLDGVIAAGRAREVKFSNMDRRVVGRDVRISPVRVKYENPIEAFQIRMIARDLTRRTVTSVVHAGNPYFLAIAQDFLDRSTFSIAIVGDTVTVIPIKQNSNSSFSHLLDIVYGNIGEGQEVLAQSSP
jgi:hypothetical protein